MTDVVRGPCRVQAKGCRGNAKGAAACLELLIKHLSPQRAFPDFCSLQQTAPLRGPGLIRDLAAPPAASRVHGDGPLDVTAVCPLTAAGSPTLKSRSDCHLWLGLDGGRNEFVTLKEHCGALKSVDARAAVAARSARKTSKWQRSDQT